jgi:hypothetical protein
MTIYYLGDAAQAACLISAGEKLKKEIGLITAPSNQAEIEENLAQVRAALGEAAFEQAWLKGQELPFDDIIQAALRGVSI